MNKKIELRLKAKELRKNLNIPQLSAKAVNLIRRNQLYKNSKHVMSFYPTKYEIDLTELFNDKKNFYLPKVNDNFLDVCPYKKGDILKKSNLNIEEPLTNTVSKNILDLVIVPALMADENHYRLGYGGGFYDRFISGKVFKTLCVIPKELYVDKLPIDNHDIPIDELIIV
jgi:5-formyltetrahydrofolate cyclo-ligase